MKLETNLRRALGLGSAKSGLHHWIAQRITAVALIPLSLWFVGVFIKLLSAPFPVVVHCFSSPWTVTFSILLIVALFYHGYLGLHVIWKDYISHDLTRWILDLSTKFLSFFMALLAIVSLFKIFLQ